MIFGLECPLAYHLLSDRSREDSRPTFLAATGGLIPPERMFGNQNTVQRVPPAYARLVPVGERDSALAGAP